MSIKIIVNDKCLGFFNGSVRRNEMYLVVWNVIV